MGFLINQGLHIHYESLGSGKPLILIHGLGSSSRHWINQLELSQKYWLILLDLRGHGLSDSPRSRDQARIPDLASDLECLVAELGLQNYVVVGHSLGGLVALYHGIYSNPRGLVLVDTFHKARLPRIAFKFSWVLRFSGLAPQILRKLWIKRALYNPSRELVQNLLAESARVNWRAAALIARNLEGIDFSAELSSIKCPTLIICGQKDRLTPPKLSIQMHRLILNSELRLIPATGHCPAQERPAEFNAVLSEFLERS